MDQQSSVLHVFRKPALSQGRIEEKLQLLTSRWPNVLDLDCELCFNIQINGKLNEEEEKILWWVLEKDFECQVKREHSFLRANLKDPEKELVIEVGPRLNFSTAFSTNAVAICDAAGIGRGKVSRIEQSILYLVTLKESISCEEKDQLTALLYDRMVEQVYPEPLATFALDVRPQPWIEVDVLTRGSEALLEVDRDLGLAFDKQDIHYYTELFRNVLKRNPTSVELFDLAQSNSEHSRHWFFKGDISIDGQKLPKSLIEMIIETQVHSNDNNVIKFEDNSSAIVGFSPLATLIPANPSQLSLFQLKSDVNRHIIFTAETHNFPTGVAPFQGATTGTGGRIRDVQAAGRGAHVIAGTAGYSFGNLLLSNYDLPWETKGEIYPGNFAKPAEVIIEASNGASDYGNKFGEPVILGFCRSCGLREADGERREWIKPIMFSGGIGSIDAHLVKKQPPQPGMVVTKVGGPVYRIGVGGGAASSVEVQGDSGSEKLNFEAVQRGDAEMEQKLNRLLRACIESNTENPILSIHDQGAGGNGNVLKEIVDPEGAVIYTNKFTLGDPTISTLDLWGAEYQESDAILIAPEDKDTLAKISAREKCPVDFVGRVTGDGRIRLVEDESSNKQLPVDLDLKHVLGSMPRKKFDFTLNEPVLRPLSLPADVTVMQALKRVLRLPSVCSKRFLTNKVDRSVTGLVAQQQCVGPLHTPLADFAMIALTHFNLVGAATSIGEQPIKGLVSCGANARMSVAEALTNIMFAKITCLEDIKCSGNWMWAAKLQGEGAALAKTCSAMCNVMKDLGIAVDGGKDSLSMAVKVNQAGSCGPGVVVKSPGTLVVSAYAPVPDVRVKVTPYLAGSGKLIHLDLSGRKGSVRSGGSALAQVYSQVGSQCADLDDPSTLKRGFKLVQQLILNGIITAGHDVSDGGLLTCILEMAFASNRGVNVNLNLQDETDAIVHLFAEECGVVIEVTQADQVIDKLKQAKIPFTLLGESTPDDLIHVTISGRTFIKDKMTALRDDWEETSFQLEKLQTRHSCVLQEQQTLASRKEPKWLLSFDPNSLPLRSIEKPEVLQFNSRPKVAVLREEGINGDREMVSSLFMAGFDVLDITTSDLLGQSNFNLDSVRGLIFPGGFSFADVLGSARGWAASLKFNDKAKTQLIRFKSRTDTFSLGVCNGCQLLALLGWVGNLDGEKSKKQGEQRGEESNPDTLLDGNLSERFESRFVSVRIDPSPSIMLQNMIGSTLGVWIAHGEGRFTFSHEQVLDHLKKNNLIALRYTDDDGHATTVYPMNPNGSVEGIAGICSEDGRHLAMMPHPERCTQLWQWPWKPKEWNDLQTSPWCSMFTSAYQWCLKN